MEKSWRCSDCPLESAVCCDYGLGMRAYLYVFDGATKSELVMTLQKREAGS